MTLPYRIQNGVGNPVDADQVMADIDWLQAFLFGNFINNGGMETWPFGTSFSDPANNTNVADNWLYNKSGTTPVTADVDQESTTVDSGTYSMKIDLTSAGSADSIIELIQSIPNFANFAGQTIIFGAKINTTTGSKVKLRLDDGVSTADSTFHSGDGSWQLLQATLTVDSTPTKLEAEVRITSDFTDAVYIDSLYVFVIPSQMTDAGKQALAFNALQGIITTTAKIANYKRPAIRWVSTSTIDVNENSDASNKTEILFRDGTFRSVTEDTTSTDKYRRFDITATAEFLSGTEDSGLYSGESESTNTWYAIYAVKSQIDSTKFVLVGTTTLPIPGNYSTLDTNFGVNGWVYLGLIRNGDNQSATGDILEFVMSGNQTILTNDVTTTGNSNHLCGIELATGSTVGSLSYAPSQGTGATDIPNNVSIGRITATGNPNTYVLGQSATIGFESVFLHNDDVRRLITTTVLLSLLSTIAIGNQGSSNYDIYLSGWIDDALGIGGNPAV